MSDANGLDDVPDSPLVASGASHADAGFETIEYDESRDSIRDGDVVLFRGKNPLSRLILWVTRSPYSHAGLTAWWGGRLMVLEAKGAGVVASRLSHVVDLYNGNAELYTATHDAESSLDRQAVVRAAKQELGKHYATTRLVRMARQILLKMGRPPTPSKPPEEFVCSEYVSYAWSTGGVALTDLDSNYVTPGEIAASGMLKQVGLLVATSAAGPDDSLRVQPSRR